MDKDSLTLKWGTLKGWHFHSARGKELLQEYVELGASMGAAQQKDTPRQKEIICELVDECNGEIWNDWEGKKMSKEEAKRYVLDYGG